MALGRPLVFLVHRVAPSNEGNGDDGSWTPANACLRDTYAVSYCLQWACGQSRTIL